MLKIGRRNGQSRQAWLASRLGSLPAGKRILDAGAGELLNKRLCEHLDYVSQDFCEYDGKGDGAGLQPGSWDTSRIDIVSDIASIPEPDGSFDVILCSEVLEHLSDPVLAVAEFSRLLKPDGILILTAPFCSVTHFAPYHFATGFNRYWYEFHLGSKGFEIVEMVPNGNWFHFVAQELWRLPEIAGSYSSRLAGRIALIAALPLFLMLAFLGGKRDRGSSEFLSFGWHVVARRRRPEEGQRLETNRGLN